jgi:hypothetical protein
MERGSSKHGPRLDDEMAHEAIGHLQSGNAGSRVEEWRQPEPAGEDQPDARLIPAGDRPGGTPPGLDPNDVEARSDLGRYLHRSVLPADAAVLRRNAESNNAPDKVLALLDRLPAGVEFETVSQVWEALGGTNERQRW